MTASQVRLKVYVVFCFPSDGPEKYVLHEQTVMHDGTVEIGRKKQVADSLKAVRLLVPPGLRRVARHRGDDPRIVESWV